MMDIYLDRLKELYSRTESFPLTPNSFGLINGNSGDILLLGSYYEKTAEDFCLDALSTLFNSKIADLNKLNLHSIDLSLGFGLTGFCHTLTILESHSIKGMPSFKEILDKIDTIYLSIFSKFTKFRSLDLFYGITGIINYCLVRPNLHFIVHSFCYFLNQNESLQGFCRRTEDGVEYLNMGVPHGLTGTILLINRILTHGFQIQPNFVEQITNEFLSYRQGSNSRFYFPGQIVLSDKSKLYGSKLSWCYGDLPAGIALFELGQLTFRPSLITLASEIFESTLNRFDVADHGGICHGPMSVGILFDKIYNLTADERYKAASNKWNSKALQYLNGNNVHHLWGDSSFFTGYSGALLSILKPSETLSWKNLLLL